MERSLTISELHGVYTLTAPGVKVRGTTLENVVIAAAKSRGLTFGPPRNAFEAFDFLDGLLGNKSAAKPRQVTVAP